MAILADFMVLAAIAGALGTLDPVSAISGLGAGAVMLIAGFALFTAGLFGGGDAKLLAASAVWFGWSGLFRFIILVALMGGLLALAVLGLRRVARARAWNSPKWLIGLCSGDHGIPYGLAIAAASWLMIYPLVGRAGS